MKFYLMKRRLILSFLIISVLSVTLSKVFAQKADNFVTVIVLDKTASMVGRGGGGATDIWAEVIDFTISIVESVPKGTVLVIYEFDANVHGPTKFLINDNSDVEKAKQHIKSVVPNGQRTGIYNALDIVLKAMNSSYAENRKIIYLITDGIDDASTMTFKSILEYYSVTRAEYDRLFYVDLRDMANDENKRLIDDTENVDRTKGYVKPIIISPFFSELRYYIGFSDSKKYEQRFVVQGGDFPEDINMNMRIQSPAGLNLDIAPSLNIGSDKFLKIEDGKYSLIFDLQIVNGIPS
jgi:hypothetical protein